MWNGVYVKKKDRKRLRKMEKKVERQRKLMRELFMMTAEFVTGLETQLNQTSEQQETLRGLVRRLYPDEGADA